MRILRDGPLLVRAVGGDDREGRGDGPTIVLCHGYGAPGEDLVSLHRVVDAGPRVRWFFPEAPLTTDFGGRAWWPIDMVALQTARGIRDMASEHPEGLAPARDTLAKTIEHLVETEKVDPERLVLGGFSQGAMVTTELTLVGDVRPRGLVVLSGALLCADRWRRAANERAPGLQVLQSHGRRDPILPFSGAEALRDLFRDAGADVTFVPFVGGHEVPHAVVDALGAFVRTRLGDVVS